MVDRDELYLVLRHLPEFELDELGGIDLVQVIATGHITSFVDPERDSVAPCNDAAAFAGRFASGMIDNRRAHFYGKREDLCPLAPGSGFRQPGPPPAIAGIMPSSSPGEMFVWTPSLSRTF